MSHNVTISGLSIEDFGILEKALGELNKEHKTDFKLIRGEVASRNYGMFGSSKTVIKGTVAVIECNGMPYDITLTKDEKTGKIGMQTEAMQISALMGKFGVPSNAMNVSTGEKANLSNARYGGDENLGMRAALGPIISRYGLLLAERQALQRGQLTRRQFDKNTGVTTLTVSVR